MNANEFETFLTVSRGELVAEARKWGVTEPEDLLHDAVASIIVAGSVDKIPSAHSEAFAFFCQHMRFTRLDELKRESRTVDYSDITEVPEDEHETVNPHLATEAKLDVAKMLATLPRETANMVRSVYIDGYTYADVAERYGMSSQAAFQKITRAINELQNKFSPR